MRRRWAALAINGALLLLAVATLGPLVWMVLASVMPVGEASAIPPRLLPSRVTLEHYRGVFSRLDLGRNFLNSLVISVAVTALSLLLNSLAGYAFAKLRFGGRNRLFGLLLATLVVPAQVAMLPLFLLLRSLGLVNSLLGVIVPGMASVFGIFLMRQYAQTLPDEVLEAARIDGASEWRIYWSLVLPLCRPILATLGAFTFMGTWNDFLWPLIILTDESRYTLPVAVANLMGEHVQDVELMMASAVITVLPVLVVFLALQRHYLAGITLGGVKE